MNSRKVLKYIRIVTYIIIGILFFILKFTNVINWTCYINENFGILCPSCGITRASIAILNFNFPLAVARNAYFTLVLFPIFLILFIDDVVCMIMKKKSFVEIILRTIIEKEKIVGGYAVIGISYILSIYLFYNLIRIRIKKEENRLNRVYVLIVLIITLIFVWNMFRIIK